jgi:hypothetical protein
MTQDQANQIQTLVNGLMFTAPSTLHPLLGVTLIKAAEIVDHIQKGATLCKGIDGEDWPNKIADIKYVRVQADCGLKEAKDFVEQHFSYLSNYEGNTINRMLIG